MKKVSAEIILGRKAKIRLKKRKKSILVRCLVPARNAVTPPLAPLLSQYGVNAIEFCTLFNEKTIYIKEGILIPCLILITPAKTFSFEIKLPTSFELFKLILNLKKGGRKNKRILRSCQSILMTSYIISRLKFFESPDFILKLQIKQILGSCYSFRLISKKN